MATQWFIVPYLEGRQTGGMKYRICGMDQYSSLIFADGGAWSETEILGNVALVKVSATNATLATIRADAEFTPLPVKLLDVPLTDLTNGQKNAIVNKLQNLGYPLAEIRNKLGNDINSVTLRQVLKFAASRRVICRYDRQSDTLVFDGGTVTPKDVDAVDTEIK